MAAASTVEADATKKRRSGSERRQQNAKFQMRMTEEQRIALDEAARRNGFRDAKEFVMFRLEQDLVAAGLAAAS